MHPIPRPIVWLIISTAAGLAGGCRTLDSYVQTDVIPASQMHLADSDSVISGKNLSRYTRELLAQLTLVWNPKDCVAALDTVASAPVDASWRLFAIAELSLEAVRSNECTLSGKHLYINGARAVDAFLKVDSSEDHRPPEHIAIGFYNRCVSGLLFGDTSTKQITPAHSAASFAQELGVTVDAHSADILQDLDRLIDADRIRIDGLLERHRRFGVGAVLIGARSRERSTPFPQNSFESGQAIALTAILQFDSTDGRGVLHIVNSADTDGAQFGARRLPLAADFSAPYAWTQRRTRMRWAGLIGTVFPQKLASHRGVFMLEPFAPGKIPVLMIHGFASSPQAWRNLTNEIYARPELHRRFQVWHYFYPSGLPYLYSASGLRRDLSDLRTKLATQYGNHAVPPIVVIGHSQGGLVARALVTRPEHRLWDTVFTAPQEQIALSVNLRATLHDALVFEPTPDIARVIFMATPHHGSPAKKSSWFAALVSALIDIPDDFSREFRKLYQRHPEQLREAVRPWFAGGGPTAVDSMADDSILLQVFGQLPLEAGVRYHSLIGAHTKDGDGIVHLSSAHLDGAESEFLFNANHRDIDGAAITAEIVRILRVHLLHASD